MSLLDAPEKFFSWLGATIRENFKAALGVGALIWALVALGIVSPPNLTIPLWVRVAGTFAVVSAIGGYLLASLRFDEPTPDWNRIVEINLDREQWIRETKVTDALLADLKVVGGPLKSPPGSSIYACRYFNRDLDNPVAQCTWKDLPDDAEMLGTKPSSIEDEICSLRDMYESTHGRHQWIVDHLYMVVRKLDLRRTRSQNRVLEDNVTPSMNGESIADVVDDVVPEEIRGDQFDALEDDEESERDRAVDELEDEVEEPAIQEAGSQPTAADGGQIDEQ